jgi:hypothetical protein
MHQRMPYYVLALSLAAGCTAATIDGSEEETESKVGTAEEAATLNVSINSSSQNRTTVPTTAVTQRTQVTSTTYALLASNDLGMHCGDVDHRVASILPPFNVIHAQAIKKGTTAGKPVILDDTTVDLYYSAAANAADPALVNPGASTRVYKTNFWDNAATAFAPYYPPGVLASFSMAPDRGLPVPDVERLYLGDGVLAATQQLMPGITTPYGVNTPQKFNAYYVDFPFFTSAAFSAFGYKQTGVKWFAAEGIPVTTYDDVGRTNPYPLVRLEVRNKTGTTLITTDVVIPVSGEANCWGCHTKSTDGGNGTATTAFTNVATGASDPLYGTVPTEVSREYAADLNILRLHDLRHATTLEAQKPVSCQKCHYTPALDLAQVGPLGPVSLYPADTAANGREQRIHGSMSHVMHDFHARKVAFPAMPPPTDTRRLTSGKLSVTAFVQTTLEQSCYSCHPGKDTKCLRGAMFNGGMVCQDCHGDASKVGNDFSRNITPTTPNAFIMDGSARIPWANEPRCQSCHTGDAVDNLAKTDPYVIKAADGIRLVQAYRTNDANAVPIVSTNRRFAENQTVVTGQPTKQSLYRVSQGHSSVACEGCHGATHAEFANATAAANDNIAATQIQGHNGKVLECTACHQSGSLPYNTLGGPHGLHQVAYQPFLDGGHGSLYKANKSACKACHGTDLKGTALSKTPVARAFTQHGRAVSFVAGEIVACNKCHSTPSL